MDDEEKNEFIRKVQKDTEDYIANLKPKKYEDGWPEDRWEEEMEKHPIFMSKPVEEGQELPPLVEALQQLKYDPDVNSPHELAKSYKEDGNQNFKRKKYRFAVASYTKGLEAKSDDKELNAILYTNRATAQYHIGNYQKALKDVTEAKSLKPDHLKAFERGAMCCWKLLLYEECISWCTEGLKLDKFNKSLLDLKKQAEEKKKIVDRDKRRAGLLALKKEKEMAVLRKAFKERGIQIAEGYEIGKLEEVESVVADSRVHFDTDGKLIWPVMLYYPEFSTTDFIQEFHEDSCLFDHLTVIFKEAPDWDKSHEYVPENMQTYYFEEDCLVSVDKKEPLKSILSNKRYKIHDGIPRFYITVANSQFDILYRTENKFVK